MKDRNSRNDHVFRPCEFPDSEVGPGPPEPKCKYLLQFAVWKQFCILFSPSGFALIPIYILCSNEYAISLGPGYGGQTYCNCM